MGSRAMKKRLGTRNKKGFMPLLYVLAVLAALLVAGGIAAYALCDSWLQDLPDYEDASAYNLAQKTRVYASDGTTLLAEFYLENREPLTSLDDISAYVTGGTVATEDVRFYEHNGVDPMGIARAFVNNITGGSTEGASTLTQQFVRNTVLSDEASDQTLKRKVREAYIALKLEEMYSKDDILLMYLNTVNYGSGAYGIEAAAQRYYSCSAKDLTLAQAALLVGIPQSPTYNNPINYPDNAIQRRNTVLNRMLTNGYITQDQYNEAINEPLNLNVSEPVENGILAYPYFTSYVRQTLLDMYSESEVFKGGLTVTTTLDVEAQEAAEKAAAQKEASVDSDIEVAMVAVDPDTGYIKALVGGKDYDTNNFNLATQSSRQAGSSFKTFTLAAAIEDGINPNTTYVDCSSTVTIGNWSLENYGDHDYGTRTIASAFAVSSNTGFARLCSAIGADKVVDAATTMGIESSLEAVPSITLGTSGVNPREMAQAYATIASGGIKREAVPIEKITDSNGDTIYQADTTGTRVISEEVAHALEQVMEGVIDYGTATDAELSSGQVAAGKTGTSQNWRDRWFCGITPQYSVAIWMGAREERTMSSSYSCSSVFSSFLDQLISSSEVEDFPMDDADDPTYRSLTSDEEDALGASSSYSSRYNDDDDDEDYSSSSNRSSSGNASNGAANEEDSENRASNTESSNASSNRRSESTESADSASSERESEGGSSGSGGSSGPGSSSNTAETPD